jgi:Tol biopolymer transport system component
MKRLLSNFLTFTPLFVLCILIATIAFNGQGNSPQFANFSDLKGPYLGQKPPGMTPEIFAPGYISTEKRELNSVFTPDGKEFYFSISPGRGYKMYFTRQLEHGWSQPQLVPFSSEKSDVDMCITPNGKRMYFGSNRPVNGKPQEDMKIWYVERTGNDWSEAKYLDSPVNEGRRALYPTVTNKGTMFFQAIRNDTLGPRDIYYSELIDGKYSEPVRLGKAINSEYAEGDVLIAPDESYIIVNCSGRPDTNGRSDLYISYRKEDGTWAELKNMGDRINSSGTDYCPMLSPDGKYFFYTRTDTGNGDIYWVDAQIIKELISQLF